MDDATVDQINQLPATPSAPAAPRAGRGPLWALAGVVIGFGLPVVGCSILLLTFFLGLGLVPGGAPAVPTGGSGDAVAVVRIQGTILSTDDANVLTGAASGRVIADLELAADDPDVKAILLRVDSPGGTVTGAAQIYEKLRTIDKPIVVSMAGTAASGGYYVSAPADYIFARPDTFTGSLGVIITFYNASELIDEIGVDVITITSGPNKDFASPWEDLPADQRAILESIIDEAYEDFVTVIAEGRDLERETVRQLADGRIYTGRQALALGLVDELGNFDDAVTRAAELGGISGEPRLIEYERTPALEDLLLGFSSRLTRSEADQVLDTLMSFTTPVLEYRYTGP